MSDRLTVLSPAFYPSRDRVRFFLDSAARQSIDPTLYGIGEQFTTWIETHVTRLLAELKRVQTDLVLVTDSADVLFAGGPDRILGGWEDAGCPEILMGVESDGQVNAGGWLAFTSVLIDALDLISKDRSSGDPQVLWRHAISSGNVEVAVDHRRSVFYVDTHSRSIKEMPRIPPVLHFPGGYSDPKTGREERMGALFRELYALQS